MPYNYLGYNSSRSGFPQTYLNMYNELAAKGCSLTNMEKCLTVRTLGDYKQKLQSIYSSNPTLSKSIGTIVDKYYNMIMNPRPQ